MKNRFKIIQNHITDSKSDVLGVLVKRQFKDSIQSGSIEDIVTEILDFSDMDDHESDIVNNAVPVWNEVDYVFYEPFFKQQRIIILGGGHVSVPLTMFAKMIGMHVVVIDDRAEFASKNRFPHADEVICDSFYNGIMRVRPCETDYVVIITRGHANDTECIKALMQCPEVIYTGLMGSRRRTSCVMQQLRDEGYDADRLNRIHTPIGLSIGAKTIEEIDISIIAEIIQVRRSKSPSNAYVDRCDHDYGVMAQVADISCPCSIATIIRDEGSTPRSAGAVMAIFEDGSIIGSIGGGSVEAFVINKGKSIINTGRYDIMTLSLDGESAMAEGMICGGRVTVLIEDFTA